MNTSWSLLNTRSLLNAFTSLLNTSWCVQDVEGAELAVIESIDWSRVSFDVIAVEAHGFNSSKEMRIAQILEQHGYSRQGYHDGANQWYVSAQRQMLMSNR